MTSTLRAFPLLLALFTAPALGQEATLTMEPEELTLANGDKVTVERGMLTVPIVRSDPESKPIQIEVYVFRAEPTAPEDAPPIFQLHGGPGWGGLGPTLRTPGGYEEAVLPFTRMADFVVVGQRGIGSSTNTMCAPPPPATPGEERTQEAEDAALQQACKECREHWEGLGYDLTGFSVIEAANDIDDVRRLLGYDQIALWGGSFGSHWGMAVMRYFPGSVARAVLTGMEGPDHTYDMPSGVLSSLERIAAAAEASPELNAHIPEGGLIEAFKSVIARVADEPAQLELRNPNTGESETVSVGPDDIRGVALGYTARASSRRGAVSWPADVLALYHGDFDRAASRLGGGGRGGLPTASFFMLDCGSGISPARLEVLENDPAAQVVGDLGHFYKTACAMWGSDLGEEFRTGFETDIPTVIVHGTWDTSTPFDNALELLPSFTDHRFVIVDGGSHGALNEALDYSPEFRASLAEFLATGDYGNVPEFIQMPPLNWEVPRR